MVPKVLEREKGRGLNWYILHPLDTLPSVIWLAKFLEITAFTNFRHVDRLDNIGTRFLIPTLMVVKNRFFIENVDSQPRSEGRTLYSPFKLL